MLLPCPHCQTRFEIEKKTILRGSSKLRCPSCKGVFRIKTKQGRDDSRSSREGSPPPDPDEETSLQEPVPEPEQPSDAPGSEATNLAIQAQGNRNQEKSGKSLKSFLILAPVCGLLVAVTGILLPILDQETVPARGVTAAIHEGLKPAQTSPAGSSEQVTKDSSRKEQQQPTIAHKESSPGPKHGLYDILRPFGTMGSSESYKGLMELQGALLKTGKKGHNHCQVYHIWIAYLALETSPEFTEPCSLDPVFNLATEAIRNKSLCGQGYAFLSAYYIHKKIVGHSLSFLEEAIHLSPQDSWVRLVEALYRKGIEQDTAKAANIVQQILQESPDFHLARYVLTSMYIDDGKYEKAKTVFSPLPEKFPDQRHLAKIHKALTSIQRASYYSTETARALLELGRVFSSLNDRILAERLCRKVLDEMPGRLPIEERKIAYFRLGRICEMQGDHDEAYASYRSALRLDPDFREARKRILDLLHKNKGIS